MTRGSGHTHHEPNSNFVPILPLNKSLPSQIDPNKNRGQRSNSREMDPEYYFRPRVAALAQEYAGTPVGSARGSLASHLDTIGVNSNSAIQRASATSGMNSVSVSRLQAAGGKEKYGERRNPTILRKSEFLWNHCHSVEKYYKTRDLDFYGKINIFPSNQCFY